MAIRRGVDKAVRGAELLDKMRDQAIEYGTDYRRAQVFLVDVDEGQRKVVYTPDVTFRARALVLATGAMGRPPSIQGEGEFLGKGVSYCATCDGAFYCGREVAVVGANREAIEEAEFLTKFSSMVPQRESPNLAQAPTEPNPTRHTYSHTQYTPNTHPTHTQHQHPILTQHQPKS